LPRNQHIYIYVYRQIFEVLPLVSARMVYIYIYIYVYVHIYVSDTPPINHLVMREFVCGPPSYHLAIKGVRVQFVVLNILEQVFPRTSQGLYHTVFSNYRWNDPLSQESAHLHVLIMLMPPAATAQADLVHEARTLYGQPCVVGHGPHGPPADQNSFSLATPTPPATLDAKQAPLPQFNC